MCLHELLNYNLSLIQKEKTTGNSMAHVKSWFNQEESLYLTKENIEPFNVVLEKIYSSNKNIYTKFTRQKIYKFIEDKLVKNKKINKEFSRQDEEGFFSLFEQQKPQKNIL